MNEITIIIITYKSEKVIYDFIKKIPSAIKTIIIENSQNYELKKNIEEKYNNISVHIKENDGVSSALNFAVEKIETKYFLQISPDLEFNFEDLDIFFNFAKKKNDRFAAIGPRFLDVNKKSHKQIREKIEHGEIDSIHGSCMFINKESFFKIGKFDENFFLYFEETEFCHRAKNKGYLSYQINSSKVKTKGRSVDIENENNENFSNILIWHFIWSKYYFHKKKYGNLLSLIIFIPLLARTIFRIIFYKIKGNVLLLDKYKTRLDGLLKSIKGKKSSLRP
jgi:GT2 family glycosyltransferase